MDKSEAQKLLTDYVSDLKSKTYEDLLKFQGKENIHTFERTAPSGKGYQFEMYSFIDDEKQKTLMVIAHIMENPIISRDTVSDSFIIRPDGTMVTATSIPRKEDREFLKSPIQKAALWLCMIAVGYGVILLLRQIGTGLR